MNDRCPETIPPLFGLFLSQDGFRFDSEYLLFKPRVSPLNARRHGRNRNRRHDRNAEYKDKQDAQDKHRDDLR